MWWRRKRESDLERELQSHLDLEIEEQDGDAFAARRATGNRTLIQENTRAAWGWTHWTQIGRDLRQGTRMMRRRPVFTAVAILSLAIGIGANTAIFSFANPILIRTLPVPGANRLVILRQHNEAFHLESCCFTYAFSQQLRAQDKDFENLTPLRMAELLMKESEQAERLRTEFVAPNYFDMLGVRAAAGRLLSADDGVSEGNGAVAVISHRLWSERFGMRPDVIGRTVELNGTPFQIIGVSQPGFAGLSLQMPRDMQVPSVMMGKILGDPRDRSNSLEIMARLRPGISQERALAQLDVLGKRLEREAGQQINDKDNFRFLDGSQGSQSSKEKFGRPLVVLMLLVGVVLLVACANLAALLLVRSVERSKEAGMRVALGASRLVLFRQFFAESFMLALTGGVAGWGVTVLLVQILSSFLAAQNPDLVAQVKPDATVFMFASGITLAAAILFGVLPAWRASKADPLPAIHGSAQLRTRRGPVLSHWIIAAQVALSLALLFSAGLFRRTLGNLRAVDLGFEPENLILLQPSLQGTVHAGRAALPFYQDLLQRAEQLPGIRAASIGGINPLSGNMTATMLRIPGYAPGGATRPATPTTLLSTVSAGYFRTMGIPLLSGEDFPREVVPGEETPVIVNEQFSRQFLEGAALGRTFSFGGGAGVQARVIGMVGTAKFMALREDPQATMYLPFRPPYVPGLLQVRTSGNPQQVIEQLRAMVKAADPGVPIYSISTMEMKIDEALGRERLLAFLSAMLGGVAVTLSAIGLYGVLAFSVVRRTREIGIRMAIGARPQGILGMFLKQGGWPVIGGLLLGIPLAYACGKLAETLLYGLQPQDTATMLEANGLLLLIAIASALIPSWRAARIDPIQALRHE